MSLLNIIKGIDERFITEELKSFIITYKEDNGKEQTSKVSGNSESDAKRRFMDSKEGRDIRVTSVAEDTEEQLEEETCDGEEYSPDDTGAQFVREENTTSNLDGGLGQPKIPHAFQRNKPSASDKRKERSNATSSTGYDITNVKKNNYANKVDEMMNRVERIVESINEAGEEKMDDAWVVYITADASRLEKKKIADKKSKLAATRLYNQMVRHRDFGTKYTSIGMMRKDIWDSEEAPWAVESISEGKYADFKNDVTMTPKQKINISIAEVNRSLYEVERMINHAMKLKTEVGMGADVFWSTTRSKFSKISERMLRIGNKLREFNK